MTVAAAVGAARGGAGGPEVEPFQQQISNYKRRTPAFVAGTQPWEIFINDFNLTIQQSGFVVQADVAREAHRQQVLKGLLYQSLTGEAKLMAGSRMYPENADMRALN